MQPKKSPERYLMLDPHRTQALNALCEVLGASRLEVMRLGVDILCRILKVDPTALNGPLRALRETHWWAMEPLMPGVNPKRGYWSRDKSWTPTHHFDVSTIPDPDSWREKWPH